MDTITRVSRRPRCSEELPTHQSPGKRGFQCSHHGFRPQPVGISQHRLIESLRSRLPGFWRWLWEAGLQANGIFRIDCLEGLSKTFEETFQGVSILVPVPKPSPLIA